MCKNLINLILDNHLAKYKVQIKFSIRIIQFLFTLIESKNLGIQNFYLILLYLFQLISILYYILITFLSNYEYFRYLVQSILSESPTLSYVGVALSKEHYISWISQLKTVLHHCMTGLEKLRPEIVSDHKSILLRLHTLVSFTSPGTWAIHHLSGMEKLKAGMNQLCANIMGHLVNNGFYNIMQVRLNS